MEIPAASWSKGKAYHFLTHAVAPRPIGWITTLNENQAVNAAPFSWFQSVCADPPTLMVAVSHRDGEPKDTSRNLQATGECVVHVVPAHMAKQMVETSVEAPASESEVDMVGLETTPSHVVAPPRLVGPPVAMECRLQDVIQIGDVDVLFLEILHTYMDNDACDERGNLRPDVALMARLGGNHYLESGTTYTIDRPPN